MVLSFKRRRGPSSSIVSGDQSRGSLRERGRNLHHPLGFCSAERPGEPDPPEAFFEESIHVCPVASGDALTGGHGHQAGVEHSGGHEAQLGRLEVAQERPEQGHVLRAQCGHVFLLQISTNLLRTDDTGFGKCEDSSFLKKMDQAKQSSVGERWARWSTKRQQAEVGSLYHAQEGGTHRVGQILQLKRPGIKQKIRD